jgi:hypothetical protein
MFMCVAVCQCAQHAFRVRIVPYIELVMQWWPTRRALVHVVPPVDVCNVTVCWLTDQLMLQTRLWRPQVSC